MDKIDVVIKLDDGKRKTIGYVDGETLFMKRSSKSHLYKGGANSVQTAMNIGTASWGLDCLVAEGLLEKGVLHCTIRSDIGVYVTTLRKFIAEGYIVQYGNHRAQFMLRLKQFERKDDNHV